MTPLPPAPMIVMVFEDWLIVMKLPPAKTIVPELNVVSVPVVLPLALKIFAKASMVTLAPLLEIVTMLPWVTVDTLAAETTTEPFDTPTLAPPAPSNDSAEAANVPEVESVVFETA